MLEQDRYRTYADLTLDELSQVVDDLENMSIHALKPVSYTHLTLPTNREV